VYDNLETGQIAFVLLLFTKISWRAETLDDLMDIPYFEECEDHPRSFLSIYSSEA
jgi:hypothetical protein